MSFLRGPSEMVETLGDMPDLDEILPSCSTYWTGYPLKSKPMPLNPNLLVRERNKL